MRGSKYSPLTACAVLVGSVLAAPARAAPQDTTGVGSLSGSVVDAAGTPAGFGHSQGLEFSLTKKDDGRWYGLANASISTAQHAALDGVLRPGSFDYPFVLNVTGGRRWSPKWESSLKLSYLSGRPYTPFDMDESTGQRRGIYDLSRINAVRAPSYFRFDARIDRNTTIAGKPVIVFLGIQNLTGRRNVNGFEWNRRANAAEPLEQLGVFPLVGLEWRF